MPNLVGTGLNQVPTNSMLGGLAYQDPEHASIKDLDLKNLSQINSEIAESAHDLFVYDTRKDSDGGAWRKRTQNTSWYNETLNTPTRGSRREFPAVAVIISETNKITIYDGDDPDLPMWMVFNPNGIIDWATSSTLGRIKVTAVNGIMGVATNDGGNLTKFVEDYIDIIYSSANYDITTGRTISDRNNSTSYNSVSNSATRVFTVIHYDMHDIAMRVFPNAPIDSSTGLPTPTVAVGTAYGVSVIQHTGTVIDLNDSSGARPATVVRFRGNTLTWNNAANGTIQNRWDIDTMESDAYGDPGKVWRYDTSSNGGDPTTENITAILYGLNRFIETDPNDSSKVFTGANTFSSVSGPHEGVSIISDEIDRSTDYSGRTINDSRVAYVSSDYNTGYMHGAIKGAFCSNIDSEDDVELISNGHFDTDTSGWTVVGGGTATINGHQAQLTNNGTNNGSLDQTITTVVGKTYKVSADISPQGGGPLPRLYVGNRYVQVGNSANVQQTLTLLYTATSTSTIVSINANTNVNNAVTLANNVSMKLTNNIIGPELIVNGTFASDTAWVVAPEFSDSQYTISGGTLRVDSNSTYGEVRSSSSIKLAVGKKYKFALDVIGHNGNYYIMLASSATDDDPNRTGLINVSGTGSKSFEFTAAAETMWFYVACGNAGSNYVEIDNLTMQPVEEDRSVNNNGLGVYGTITRTPVATGAELLAYSGFSTSAHLRQPPNTSMNFGTGGGYSMIWYKTTDSSATMQLMSYEGGANGTTNYGTPFNVRMESGRIRGWASHNNFTNYDSVHDNDLTSDNEWHCAVWVRRNTTFELYVDGKLRGTASGQVGSNALGDVNTELVIGGRKRGNRPGTSEEPFNGSLALARIGHSPPSPEVIKKMYNEEKHLFQPNAKATLYGTSNAVTAISYDDTKHLLHVGTSAGRSDFQGVCRINNTTTAVTTAISASNGFIAEQ